MLHFYQTRIKPHLRYLLSALFIGLLTVLGGCLGTKEAAKEAPPVDTFCLQPGQSAMVLEDTVLPNARVPFQGDRLFEGKVRVSTGTLVTTPVQEGQQ